MLKATLTLAAVSLALLLSTSVSADDGNGLAFRAELSGAQEVPEVLTGTSGRVTLMFDSALSEARFVLRVQNGTGVTQAHFHCGRPGANGPVIFFLFGFVMGGVDVDGVLAEDTLTNTDFSGADCVPVIDRPVNNIASLAFAARDGLIYANVHTVANPTGEVRGQLLSGSNGDSDVDELDHTHTYLTGRGQGHNNTEAETSTGEVLDQSFSGSGVVLDQSFSGSDEVVDHTDTVPEAKPRFRVGRERLLRTLRLF